MQSLGEKINELCNSHFKSLPSKGKPLGSEWTVLSAVVIEIDGELSVVSMATGTKCVDASKYNSMCVLQDSHAETLSLRLFRLFLLHEMSRINANEGSGFLERADKGFTVKPGISFHFYSSHVLCGDATINVPVSNQDSGKQESNLKRPPSPLSDTRTPSKHLRSTSTAPSSNKPPLFEMTRSGAKCLQVDDLTSDSIKHRSWDLTSVIRSKPGRGPLCLSLSCSDKLMKRQALGSQGCLLSVLLPQPIRFSSVVIGGDFSEESVNRALFTRLPARFRFPAQIFRVKDIYTHSLSNKKLSTNRGTINPASTSLLWCREAGHWVGVKGRIQGATKNCITLKAMLPVCRANMMSLARQLVKDLVPGFEFEYTSESASLRKSDYERLRQLSTAYRDKKTQLREYFPGWKKKVGKAEDKLSIEILE